MRLFLSALLIASSQTFAGEIAVGRYTRIVSDAPTQPLSTPVLSGFAATRSIGDAVASVLSPSGYRLADPANTDPKQAALLRMPLPHVHRDLSALASISALVLLGGPGYRVMVDHVHRLVGFEVRPRFWHYAGRSARKASTTHSSMPRTAWTCSERRGEYRCVARVST